MCEEKKKKKKKMSAQRKHTDLPFITASEWARDFGGKKTHNSSSSSAVPPPSVPFDCCALSMAPFNSETVVCTRAGGVVHDLLNILPFIRKHGVDPATGNPLTRDDLITLRWHRNAETGKYQCPMMIKEFGVNSKIVAVATTGNVFSWEAVEQLNIKAGYWKDLLTGTEFTKDDLIILQDPEDPKSWRRRVTEFFSSSSSFKHKGKNDDGDDGSSHGVGGGDDERINMTATTEKTLKELAERDKSRRTSTTTKTTKTTKEIEKRRGERKEGEGEETHKD